MSGGAPPFLFAHRGGRAHGPDNTLATFRTALERGATGLETDAWLTGDGVVVLDHDGVHKVARRTRVPLGEVTRAELPAHIPALSDLYRECGHDFDLAIDVRRPEVAAAVVAVARQFGATHRLWLVSGRAELIAEWGRLDPGVRLAMTIRPRTRGPATVQRARAAGARALNLRWPWWDRQLVRNVHEAGLLAFGYDAQSRFALRRCARLGLDGVFSDHVERMHTTIARQLR